MMTDPQVSAPASSLSSSLPSSLLPCTAFIGLDDLTELPEGDGHPVIIFPGAAGDERALLPVRNCCEALGYAVYDWEQGFSSSLQGATDEWLHNLAEHVGGVATLHGRRVSLLGWGVGGLHAREVAMKRAPLVRQVLTLGTAFVDDQLARRLRTTPPVPATSICRRTDGVVACQTCLLDGRCRSAYVEVDGSDNGLHAVLRLVAQQLSQPEETWR
ncbi:esterase/lipase family protein [Sphaerotilaceae bacterium SBD11-9]